VPKRELGKNVFDAALERFLKLYREGHRVVVSFSGGKDSGICLELALIAASMTDRLPIEVVMRDEEVMMPGTFEYCERVAARPEIDFHWLVAGQPVVNIFNRENPYFWVFDYLLKPEEWVRQPPDFAEIIPEQHIEGMVIPYRFPPKPGKTLITVTGLRTSESPTRTMSITSSKGFLTKPNMYGVRYARPIYDWKDGDVWKAMGDNGWDYNIAYDVLKRGDVSSKFLRIAPITLTAASLTQFQVAAKAFPKWFEKVCKRLPGSRSAVMFGRRAVEPMRQFGEFWEDCFKRTCIEEAPEWIRMRAEKMMKGQLSHHRAHSQTPFPDVAGCPRCGRVPSWHLMAKVMFMGDPFSLKQSLLSAVEPEAFRLGAGLWGGKPTF